MLKVLWKCTRNYWNTAVFCIRDRERSFAECKEEGLKRKVIEIKINKLLHFFKEEGLILKQKI